MTEERRITIHRLSERRDFGANLAREVCAGLLASPKWFPTKYLYDREGAALFEQFACQPHYYLRPAETALLRQHARDVMELVRPGEMVELGSGASTKTRLLLEAMHAAGCTSRYVPLEISDIALERAAEELTADYAWLKVDGYLGDFDTDLPKLARSDGVRRLMVFLGNTVGNFRTRNERVQFLGQLSSALIPGDALLLGVDLLKSVEDIFEGYQDPDEIGKQFLLRSVEIMKSELGATISNDSFRTMLLWNPCLLALEMRLVAERETEISLPHLNMEVTFSAGDFVRLALSTKFTREVITEDLKAVGLKVSEWYLDSEQQYGLLVATPQE